MTQQRATNPAAAQRRERVDRGLLARRHSVITPRHLHAVNEIHGFTGLGSRVALAHRGLRTSEITRGLAGLTALSRSASVQRYASSDVRVGLAATKMVESLQGGLARAESAFVAEKNLAFKLAPFRNLTATGDPRGAAGVITGSRRVAVEQRHLARLPPARITETVGAAAPRYRLDLESVADRLQGRGLVTESYRSLLGGYWRFPAAIPTTTSSSPTRRRGSRYPTTACPASTSGSRARSAGR